MKLLGTSLDVVMLGRASDPCRITEGGRLDEGGGQRIRLQKCPVLGPLLAEPLDVAPR